MATKSKAVVIHLAERWRKNKKAWEPLFNVFIEYPGDQSITERLTKTWAEKNIALMKIAHPKQKYRVSKYVREDQP